MAKHTDLSTRAIDPAHLASVTDLQLLARAVVEGLMTGLHRSPHSGASIEFAQYRPYTQGDDLRHIDWKVFARTDKLYVPNARVSLHSTQDARALINEHNLSDRTLFRVATTYTAPNSAARTGLLYWNACSLLSRRSHSFALYTIGVITTSKKKPAPQSF